MMLPNICNTTFLHRRRYIYTDLLALSKEGQIVSITCLQNSLPWGPVKCINYVFKNSETYKYASKTKLSSLYHK